MIYEKYKKRMFWLAKLWSIIKRYRILITSVLLTILATTSTLLATSGALVDVSACPAEIVYGEEIKFEANAFLSETASSARTFLLSSMPASLRP